MTKDLDFTQGSISKKILLFSLPLMAGNIFQQLYNVVDTLIVGRFLGEAPLAAVGSAYTLMIFITSILIGLTMGSGVYFSICHGQKNTARMKQSIYISYAWHNNRGEEAERRRWSVFPLCSDEGE